MSSDVGDWYRNIPRLTRWWFTGAVALPLLGRFGLINPYYLVLMYEQLVYKFELWRLVTAVFFYPINPRTGFHYLMNLFFLYNYSVRLEKDIFGRQPADYAFLLIFIWLASTVLALFMDIMMLMDMLVICVIYIWCQLNPDTIVQFWFGTQFKAVFLPWAYLILTMVIGGNITDMILGIIVGHLYYFLKFKYPVEYNGPSLLDTPNFLYNYFPMNTAVGGFGQHVYRPAAAPPPAAGRPQGGGHDWGRGNNLH